MNKLYLLIIPISLILILTGCVNTPQPKCTINSIENSLTKEEKKQLFINIQHKINNLKDEADSYYAQTYYLDALKTYELINFYNNKQIIAQDTINRLLKRIEANKKHYYNKAMNKKIATDKMKKLFYLNELMRNDPEYKDGKALYNTLRKDKEIEKFLEKDTKALSQLLEKDLQSESYIKKLHNTMIKIAKYNDLEPLVIKAKKVLKDKRTVLQKEGITLYKEKKIDLATKKFNFIKTIYKKDRTANKYLYLMSKNSKLSTMEKKAQNALKNGHYKEAIGLANKMLSFNNKNSKALNIFKKANSELKKQIPKMIKKATIYYSQQDYDKALSLFKEVLKLDSTNNTALTYTKKIKAQLKTIKSLQEI